MNGSKFVILGGGMVAGYAAICPKTPGRNPVDRDSAGMKRAAQPRLPGAQLNLSVQRKDLPVWFDWIAL
jgi:hypothetical protein